MSGSSSLQSRFLRSQHVSAIALVLIVLCSAPVSRGDGTPEKPVAPPVRADFVLKGGTLIDGTGAPARKGDLAVRGDKIVAVGSFPIDPKAKVVDVASLVVAPGFIDLHTHSDDEILKPKTRLNLNYLTQG